MSLRTQFQKEYWVWAGMKDRCSNSKRSDYKYYGGRGITVCERWKISFANFLADMGPKSPGMKLDRKDNDGNYEPSNCRWATHTDQTNNQSSNHQIEFWGQTKTIAAWARETGLKESALYRRIISNGWPVDVALTLPSKPGQKVMHWINKIL